MHIKIVPWYIDMLIFLTTGVGTSKKIYIKIHNSKIIMII
jgi:hypothetical protein